MSPLLADIEIPLRFYLNTPSWSTQCATVRTGPLGQLCNLGPAQLVSILLPNLLVGAGVIFFGLILFGGLGMIAGAGKESSAQDKAKASAAVTYGVIGFLLVVSAYFILQIVEVIAGINFINPPTL